MAKPRSCLILALLLALTALGAGPSPEDEKKLSQMKSIVKGARIWWSGFCDHIDVEEYLAKKSEVDVGNNVAHQFCFDAYNFFVKPGRELVKLAGSLDDEEAKDRFAALKIMSKGKATFASAWAFFPHLDDKANDLTDSKRSEKCQEVFTPHNGAKACNAIDKELDQISDKIKELRGKTVGKTGVEEQPGAKKVLVPVSTDDSPASKKKGSQVREF